MGISIVYKLENLSVLSERSNREIVSRYVRPAPKIRILDIGCGTARVLGALSDVDYLGIDHNAGYIARASRKYGASGTFKVADVSEISDLNHRFDRILLFGVLHHLSDDQVQSLLRKIPSLLQDGGFLVTGYDPVFHDGQGWISKRLAKADRGQFVRNYDEYVRLLESALKLNDCDLRTDVLRFPYSHLFTTATAKTL
jgi:SAM-dependent methyltransferase